MKRFITSALGTDAQLGIAAHAGGLLVPLLYTWIIPHLDHERRIALDPATIRLRVVPNLPVSQVEIADAINELVKQGLVTVRHAEDNEPYLQFPPAVFNEPPYMQARRAAQTRPSAIGRDQQRAELPNRDQSRPATSNASTPPLPPVPSPDPIFTPSLSPQKADPKKTDPILAINRSNGAHPAPAEPPPNGRARIIAAAKAPVKTKALATRSPKQIPRAVEVYREIARIYPIESWWQRVERTVGLDLDRWRDVVLAYCGQGWNKGNIANMLSFFERGEMPGSKNGHGKAEAPMMSEKAAGWLRLAGRA